MNNCFQRRFRQPDASGRPFREYIFFLIAIALLTTSLLWGCTTTEEKARNLRQASGDASSSCKTDGECSSNSICIDDVCQPGCRVTSDCAFPKICQNNGGTPVGDCVPENCAFNADCRHGAVCTGNICSALPCPKEPGICSEDLHCSDGRCYPKDCENDSDCTASATSCVVRVAGTGGLCLDNP